MQKLLVGLGVLVLVGIVGFAWTTARQGPVVQEPTFGETVNFTKTGVATFNNPGQPMSEAVLVYEEPGSPALTRILVFGAESMCASGGGELPCMAMSVTLDMPFGGKRVYVEGVDNGTQVLVRRIQTVPEGQEGAEDLVTRLGQGVSTHRVTVVPHEVLEDSRCPSDVQCVQAGTVRVRATLGSGLGDANQVFELGQPITTETEVVTLVQVQPYPRQGQEIAPEEYEFTFSVGVRTDLNY